MLAFVQALFSFLQSAVSWMPYFCIFTVLAYVFCYGFGLGPIPYFIGSGRLASRLMFVLTQFTDVTNSCLLIGVVFVC
jgi:hypothetical protein